MNFHILSLEESLCLKLIFEHISFKTGRKLQRNPTADERGLTDDVFDELANFFSGQSIRLPGNSTIHCDFRKPHEGVTGADILIRATINSKEFSTDRFVLIQAKKYLEPIKQFNESNPGNSHLEGQIQRMSQFAPIFNYVLLYCRLDGPTGNMLYGDFPFLHTFYLPLTLRDTDEILYHLHHKFPYLQGINGKTPIVLLQGRNWQKIHRPNPTDLVNISDPFSYFMVEDLFKGKIGHDWNKEIQEKQNDFSFQMTIKISKE
jgi:hypothetical protein